MSEKGFVERLKNIGPGAVVAAAFIGPGTVTTCTFAGGSYGYTLLWAMLFSTITTIILQEMAARLGIVTQSGLGEALREKYKNPTVRILLAILVICAVFFGNVAYETGNVSGSTMGLMAIVPGSSKIVWAIAIGLLSFFLLITGKYKYIEKFLVALVILMSVVFLATALAVGADWGAVFKGLFVPSVPKIDRAWFYIAGLLGTTVVPYNIYLHASSAAKKWKTKEDVVTSRLDSIVSIGLGGLISMCIIITASAAFYGTGAELPKNGGEMAAQLAPLLGSWAKYAFGIGLFAAGMSSAITAPLAAAFASSGILGWGEDMSNTKFKAIWLIVLCFGVGATCTIGASPTEIIMFAQAANAFLRPKPTRSGYPG